MAAGPRLFRATDGAVCTAADRVDDRAALVAALTVNPEFLRNAASESGLVTDYRNWQIPLGRRFRALKLWFVMRSYGIEGLRAHIRQSVELARCFEQLVRSDDRFELVAPVRFALVCFRLRHGDETNRRLEDAINATGRVYLVHTVFKGRYVLRYAVCNAADVDSTVRFAWDAIVREADAIVPRTPLP